MLRYDASLAGAPTAQRGLVRFASNVGGGGSLGFRAASEGEVQQSGLNGESTGNLADQVLDVVGGVAEGVRDIVGSLSTR